MRNRVVFAARFVAVAAALGGGCSGAGGAGPSGSEATGEDGGTGSRGGAQGEGARGGAGGAQGQGGQDGQGGRGGAQGGTARDGAATMPMPDGGARASDTGAPSGTSPPAVPPGPPVAGALYVAPDGTVGNPGTMAAPTTIYKAITIVAPGGMIYMRGGTYKAVDAALMYAPTIVIAPGNNGVADNPKRLFAFPGEKPILDFASQPYVRGRANPRGIELKADYWHIKGLEITNAGDNGIFLTGSYNVIEQCVFHHNRDSGLQLGGRDGEKTTPPELWPRFNKIINCDSYNNFDPPDGGDADGFAPKLNVGEGNEFRGCRAWNNSDDGWDLFTRGSTGAIKPILIDQCMAFDNGYESGGYMSMPPPKPYMGNGNGFKMGGEDLPVNHTITRSIAFGNKVRGFDENNNTGTITVKNNTGWLNGSMNFAFGEGGQHVFINNLSHVQRAQDEPVGTRTNNSWGMPVSDADFVSLDRALAKAPRNPDGSLPVTDFLRLAPMSKFIDAGSTTGPALPYKGTAPDLGAIETR